MESNDSPEIPDSGETSDITGLPSVVLCVMVLLTPVLVTLTIFQSHGSVNQFSLKILWSYPLKLKLCSVHQVDHEYTTFFW